MVEKGENAGNQHFLPFPTMFSTLSKTEVIIIMSYIYFVVCKSVQFGQVQNFVMWLKIYVKHLKVVMNF